MLHRSFPVSRNNNLDSITYLNINLHLSQAAILDLLHTLEDLRTSIRSRWWDPHKLSLRTLCLEGRGGCELPQLIGHRGVMDHPAMSGRTVGWTVGVDRLKVQMNLCPVEGPEEDGRLGCQMMSGRDNEKIIM